MSCIRSKKHMRIKLFVCVLVLAAVLLCLSICVALLPDRLTKMDVADTSVSRVSRASLRFAGDIREDVRVYWLCADGATDYSLDVFLSRYEEAGDHISVQVVDTTAQPEFLSDYLDLEETDELGDVSLTNYSLIIASDRRATILDFTDLYLFSNDVISSALGSETLLTYSQLAAVVEQYSSLLQSSVTSRYFCGESRLSAALEYVTADEIPEDGFVSSFDDISPICLDGNSLSGLSRGGAAVWSLVLLVVLPGVFVAVGVVSYRKRKG